MSKKDEVVISFHDSLIRQSDIKILEGQKWLNDRIIGFYFEYLFEKVFDRSSGLVFISPEVSQFLKMAAKEELGIFLEPLALEDKDLIVLAVNNSNDPERPGGSHWSLLMYSRQAQQFFHFDSMSEMNRHSAREIASKTYAFLSSKSQERLPSLRVKEVPVLQQTNGHDCGIHLLCNAQHATRHMLLYGSDNGLELLKPEVAESKRSELKKLIYELKGETTARSCQEQSAASSLCQFL